METDRKTDDRKARREAANTLEDRWQAYVDDDTTELDPMYDAIQEAAGLLRATRPPIIVILDGGLVEDVLGIPEYMTVDLDFDGGDMDEINERVENYTATLQTAIDHHATCDWDKATAAEYIKDLADERV